MSAVGGSVKFEETTPVPVNALIQLLQSNPKEFKLGVSDALRFVKNLDSVVERKDYVDDLLQRLSLIHI